MTVHLLDTASFSKISQLKWRDIYESANNATLRNLRPKPDSKLISSHDIDSEVELLDWMDSLTIVDNGVFAPNSIFPTVWVVAGSVSISRWSKVHQNGYSITKTRRKCVQGERSGPKGGHPLSFGTQKQYVSSQSPKINFFT